MAKETPLKKAPKEMFISKDDVPLMFIGLRRANNEEGNVRMDFTVDTTTCSRREVEACVALLAEFVAFHARNLAETPEQGDKAPDGSVLPKMVPPPAIITKPAPVDYIG
jgi:hypothetical protein